MSIGCGKLAGSFTRKITVTTNDPDHPSETLLCKGRILEPAKVSPVLVSFGSVSGTAVERRTLSITAGDGGPLKPEIAPIDRKGVSATLREIEPGKRYEAEIRLTPPVDPGRLRTQLVVKTGIAEAPMVRVPVVATVQGPTTTEGPARE